MTIHSIHKKYTGLQDNLGNFNFCTALYYFKELMVSNNFFITKSGYSNEDPVSPVDALSLTGDVFTSSALMSYKTIWFVLRTPDNKELLFYRNNYFNTKSKSTGLYIGYSANSLFSSTIGVNGYPISETIPPMANDAVWLSGYPDIFGDLFLDLNEFPAPPDIAQLPDSDLLFGSAITDTTQWTFHTIMNDVAPYSFYFFITYKVGNLLEQTGLFCMDNVDAPSEDLDKYVFWVYPNGIQESEQDFYSHKKNIRAWYHKELFATRLDYIANVSSSVSRFLPTVPNAFISETFNDNYNTNYIVQSNGDVLDLSNKDQENTEVKIIFNHLSAPESRIIYMFNLYYTRGNVYATSKSKLFGYSDMAPSYKGASALIKIPSLSLIELSTLNYLTQNEFIIIGKNVRLSFTWDGSTL